MLMGDAKQSETLSMKRDEETVVSSPEKTAQNAAPCRITFEDVTAAAYRIKDRVPKTVCEVTLKMRVFSLKPQIVVSVLIFPTLLAWNSTSKKISCSTPEGRLPQSNYFIN